MYPESRALWTDTEDEVLALDGNFYTKNKATIWRWREAYQNDFSARIDWTIKSYKDANHSPIIKLAHNDTLIAKGRKSIPRCNRNY